MKRGYGFNVSATPPPLVSSNASNGCDPTKTWCANCFKNGHPAYQCPLPHRKVWPTPMYQSRKALP